MTDERIVVDTSAAVAIVCGEAGADDLVGSVELDPSTAERALEGWRRFGKGRHQAALNFGDCFAYGLASELGAPVLCIGNDFVRTDVPVKRPDA